MTLLDHALTLAKAGYAVHWLRPRSKAPLAGGWSTAPVASISALQQAYRPGVNLGVRCGRLSQPKPGYGLVVTDIDVKAPDAHCEPFEVLGRFYNGPVVDVLSGSGLGRHWWFQCPLDILPLRANYTLAKSPREVLSRGKKVPAWTIEILSTGKNLVVPPSIHPDTGKSYRWLIPSWDGLPLLPESIRELACCPDKPAKAPREPLAYTGGDDSIADAFNAAVSWADILEPHGWQFVRQQGERMQWCRPGKSPCQGISATTTTDVFYCFSSSTTFEPERGYSKFGVYAVLEHGGDMHQAARALRALQRRRAA